MLTVLFPMCGNNHFGDEAYLYPKPLVEIKGSPIIERVIANFDALSPDRYVFIVNEEDCQRYQLDAVLRLIAGDKAIIIPVQQYTQGALCTALLAIDYLDNGDELIISNSDHILDVDLGLTLAPLRQPSGIDSGVVCFPSVHPKWSYVQIEDGNIIRAAEKHPISRHAIAGVYYYRHAQDFVKAAMRVLEKQAHVDGIYYLSSALNEMVLQNKTLKMVDIPSENYHHFYSPQKVHEYEAILETKNPPLSNQELLAKTKAYVAAFSAKNLDAVAALLADRFVLEDPVVKRIEGKPAALAAISNIFSSCQRLDFSARNIFCSGQTTVIEFALHLDGLLLTGTDIIEWQQGLMVELRAYLDIPKN